MAKKMIEGTSTEPTYVETPSTLEKPKKSKLFRVIFLVVLLVAILGIAGSVYYYKKYQAVKDNPSLAAQKDVDALVSTVSKLMELPKENPTVATILDTSKLKGQSFFNNAQNGDKLLAFTKAMKAVLYRPSTNKIIEVAPIYVNSGDQSGQATSTATTTTESNPAQ